MTQSIRLPGRVKVARRPHREQDSAADGSPGAARDGGIEATCAPGDASAMAMRSQITRLRSDPPRSTRARKGRLGAVTGSGADTPTPSIADQNRNFKLQLVKRLWTATRQSRPIWGGGNLPASPYHFAEAALAMRVTAGHPTASSPGSTPPGRLATETPRGRLGWAGRKLGKGDGRGTPRSEARTEEARLSSREVQ